MKKNNQNQSDSKPKKISQWSMLAIAFLVGIFGGIGAVLFRKLIALIDNIAFFGKFSAAYHETIHAPNIWGIFVILIPIMGSFIVTWLVNHFASKERGMSVPVIMQAIYYNEGRINPLVSLAKILSSAISIGTGGSVGREGPIAQIGAAITSIFSDLIKISAEQRTVLIAAGAAAGTAAIFKTPLAGIGFAIEFFFVPLTVFNILLIVVATTTATIFAFYIFGNEPIFLTHYLPSFNSNYVPIIPLFFIVLMGLFIGLISPLLIKSVYWTEDLFKASIKNSYLRHALGMGLVGLMMYFLMKVYGHYYIEGIGFATIQDILNLSIKNFWLLILLFIAKFIATSLTIGSGASGGIFSPTLYLGATLGGACALALHYFLPGQMDNPIIFVAAGMAAMLATVTDAVATAILLTVEMLQNINLFLVVTLATMVAYFVRLKLCKDSVYTLQLARQGYFLPRKFI